MAKVIDSVKKWTLDADDSNIVYEYLVIYTDGVPATVPLNTGNKDYRQILAWVDAGNTIAEAD
jgi:hypothetical protein